MSDNINSTMIAILQTTCNKYEPGDQVFRVQSLLGLKEDNSTEIEKTSLNTGNILNEDMSKLPIGEVNTASVLKLPVPFEISRRYPLKFIPPGTRFLISFSSGDITKPRIVGGEF